MKVVTADEMREIDRKAIEEYGIPGVVLMENAGRGAADAIEEFILDKDIDHILVVAGKGNNGGDGFVVARNLVNRGIECEVCLAGKKAAVRGDAKVNLDTAEKMGIEIIEIYDSVSDLEALIKRSGLIVDALLGTGLNQEVSGFYRGVIEAINFSDLPVVSLDIPSGLDSTTGHILGTAVEADVTVTFCLPKIGAVIYPGAENVGELILVDIGAPSQLLKNDELKTAIILDEDMEDLLLPREADSHKGTYGHLLVVAGSTGKTGAAVMTGDAALRSGSGLVTVAAPASVNDILEVKLTEVMTEPLLSRNGEFLDRESLEQLLNIAEDKDAIVLGPGISRAPETGDLVRELLVALKAPAVIDADAIWHIAEDKEILKKCEEHLILTPHPGEMAKLLGVSSKDVQDDRVGISRKFAEEYGCWLVLKGARTVIAAPDGNVYINTTGNPGMASGGTGDVLCGMIGSLLGQGYTPPEASIAGVYLHGYAGDLVADEKGEASLIATDIIEKIPEVMKEFVY